MTGDKEALRAALEARGVGFSLPQSNHAPERLGKMLDAIVYKPVLTYLRRENAAPRSIRRAVRGTLHASSLLDIDVVVAVLWAQTKLRGFLQNVYHGFNPDKFKSFFPHTLSHKLLGAYLDERLRPLLPLVCHASHAPLSNYMALVFDLEEPAAAEQWVNAHGYAPFTKHEAILAYHDRHYYTPEGKRLPPFVRSQGIDLDFEHEVRTEVTKRKLRALIEDDPA